MVMLLRAAGTRSPGLAPQPTIAELPALLASTGMALAVTGAPPEDLGPAAQRAVYRTVRELNGYDMDTLKRLHTATEAWFHVTRKGGYFGPHNHPMHSWSGVYCVSHGGDDPASDSGKFTLINPHAMNTMYIDYGIAHMRNPYHMGNRMLRLQAGDLILFPSWMLHEVLPYEGDDLRITVAFNVRFMLQGAKPEEVPIG